MFWMAHCVRLIEHDATKNYFADASFQNSASLVTGNELNSD